jgi:hypothetical protein
MRRRLTRREILALRAMTAVGVAGAILVWTGGPLSYLGDALTVAFAATALAICGPWRRS